MVRVKRSNGSGFIRQVSVKRHFVVVIQFLAVLCCVGCYLLLKSKEDKLFGLQQQQQTATNNNIDSKSSNMRKPSSSSSSSSIFASAYSAQRIVELNKPYLVYGTAWKKEATAQHVYHAILAGFRFVDTACQPKHYNEKGVGEGWKAAAQELKLNRSDLFLQTKFTSVPGQDINNIPYDPKLPIKDQIETSIQVSLQNLQTNYIDSLVLHSPFRTVEETVQAWRVLEDYVDQGIIHGLGISNCYDLEFFRAIYQQVRIKPWVLQNRFYADSNFDTELRTFCKENNIKYQSFWTLTANRHALRTSQVQDMAAKFNLTPQTYMFAFLMSLGYITPLSGTTNQEHMAQDVAIMERVQNGEVFFSNEAEQRQFAQLLGMPDL